MHIHIFMRFYIMKIKAITCKYADTTATSPKFLKSSSGEYALARKHFEHIFNKYSFGFC